MADVDVVAPIGGFEPLEDRGTFLGQLRPYVERAPVRKRMAEPQKAPVPVGRRRPPLGEAPVFGVALPLPTQLRLLLHCLRK